MRAFFESRKITVGGCRAYSSTKPFREIPGPRPCPIVGTLPYYIPFIGKYKFDALHHNGSKKYTEFGPVVKERIARTDYVWIYKPEDVQELLRKEGKYPERRSHLALEYYRKLRPEFYNSGGLLPTNGEEWYRLRTIFQRGLSSPRTVSRYLPVVNQVLDDFTEFVSGRNFREDFLPYLSRVFLEMLGLVVFDTRLNCFSDKEMERDSTSSRLMDAAMSINSCILGTDSGFRLWRFFETPIYKKLSRAHLYLESVAIRLIQEKQKTMKKGVKESVLECYLSEENVDVKDLVGMAADMLLAGVDTTTYSTAFMLYHLAKNPEKQEKLYEESRSLLPNWNSMVTSAVLSESHYLKAVVKESFRLNPISVGIGRILTEDAVFSNYHVPKGSVVVTQNQVISRSSEFFLEPNSFLPERWLIRGEINPYLVLPFGHGPRSCIARRLAEQNIRATVAKLCRRFKIEWTGGELDVKTVLINKPNGPLLFRFIERAT